MARDGVLILCPECRKPQTLNAFEITHDITGSRCGEDVDETSIDGEMFGVPSMQSRQVQEVA